MKTVSENDALRAYRTLYKETDAKIAALDWRNVSRAWDLKWTFIDQLNRAWDELTREDRSIFVHGRVIAGTPASFSINEAVGRSRFYKRTVDRGVKGKDLIQPYLSDGKPNPDFIEHYGTKEYPKETKEYIEDRYGKE